LRGTRVVFSGSVFRQAWFSCHVHGAAAQASDMKHGRPPARRHGGKGLKSSGMTG
jgi:hypothetical protein